MQRRDIGIQVAVLADGYNAVGFPGVPQVRHHDPQLRKPDRDLIQQQRVKCAFDAKGLLNPGKVFPTLHRCAELGRMHVHAGRVAFPDIPRF